MQILVGDIGGTKCVLALAETDDGGVRLTAERRYGSRDFASLKDLVALHLDATGRAITTAAFAVAGPVQDDRSSITNLPWDLDARHLEATLGLPRVRLLNDLEAVAWGIAALGPEDFEVLHPGAPGAAGNACVVAPGTGLGEAGMHWDGNRHLPFATEGGHTDFSPTNDLELALHRQLAERHGHVSWERVVSGMGIVDIYRFLLDWRGARPTAAFEEALGAGDEAAAIARVAAAGACPVCVETMELFMDLFGREAGNLALKQMATGGVYLGGGIAPKNLELLRRGPFLRAFFDKGRMADLMRRMPVRVILEQQVPLLGVARFMTEA